MKSGLERAARRMPLTDLAASLAETLARRPSALVCDIDGTISHIALTPGAARIEPRAISALEELIAELDLVALMTGRGAAEAARMAGVPGLMIIGNHGMELLEGGRLRGAEAAEAYRETVEGLMGELVEALHFPGVIVEPKGLTGSLHYRGAPETDLAKAAILDAVLPRVRERGLRITEGRMVVEIRPPVQINKGSALRDLVRARGLRAVVFLGDDVTDIDAMLAVRGLREAEVIDGWAIGVLARETSPELLAAADAVVDGVDAAVALLTNLEMLVAGNLPAAPRDAGAAPESSR